MSVLNFVRSLAGTEEPAILQVVKILPENKYSVRGRLTSDVQMQRDTTHPLHGNVNWRIVPTHGEYIDIVDEKYCAVEGELEFDLVKDKPHLYAYITNITLTDDKVSSFQLCQLWSDELLRTVQVTDLTVGPKNSEGVHLYSL